jgi:hypothetical protein
MCEDVDQPDMGSNIGIQEWLEWLKCELMGEHIDQPDSESNIGMQEWLEWLRFDLILIV